jgi:GxxExxY protein
MRVMHPAFQKGMDLTSVLINAAIEVHRDKGPGLVESIYQWCLEKELQLRALPFVTQKAVTIHYKGFTREEPLRFDVLVEDSLLMKRSLSPRSCRFTRRSC